MLRTIVTYLSITLLATACKKPSNANTVMMPPFISTTDSTNSQSDSALKKTYLALGDSYTIGQSVAVEQRFPVQAVALLDSLHISFIQPEIIAQTGWTTGNLLNSLADMAPAKPAYDIVTLLIGVNNQYQHKTQDEYRQQFTMLLEKAIRYAGNNSNHVIVLSIPDYSVTPFASGSNTSQIAAEIDAFNAINKQISLQYAVHYLDITGYTRMGASDPSLIAGDGLHPSGTEYRVWAEYLAPIIQAALR